MKAQPIQLTAGGLDHLVPGDIVELSDAVTPWTRLHVVLEVHPGTASMRPANWWDICKYDVKALVRSLWHGYLAQWDRLVDWWVK